MARMGSQVGAGSFEQRCQVLFAEQLGYGRRWKTACARALGIGRATLYRYFEERATVAADVVRRLGELERGGAPVRDDRQMVTLYATALLDVQRRIDEEGWLSAYPESVRRVLSLGAARNITDGSAVAWPTDLDALVRAAQQPLVRWVPNMSWDVGGEFFDSCLLKDHEITTECRTLAMEGSDPERELDENLGYDMLRGLCSTRADGDAVYSAWRRTVVENPLLENWSSVLRSRPILATVERIDEIVEHFYERVPESLAIDGRVPICTVSRTILRRTGRGYHTECRNPEAIRRARSGEYKLTKYRRGMLYLKRAFRVFWCLPGVTELELERRLTAGGWSTVLWPHLDRVDLTATSPVGRRIAADVKDYISPANLAARFTGFKEYSDEYQCFLVVPDYIAEIEPRFRSRFEAVRAAQGKAPVALRSVSDLLSELKVA